MFAGVDFAVFLLQIQLLPIARCVLQKVICAIVMHNNRRSKAGRRITAEIKRCCL